MRYRGFVICFFLFVNLVAFLHESLNAQSTPFPPPRQIEVFATQELSFGDFFTGAAGGSVIISPTGMRTASGTVILSGGFWQQAIFEVSLLPGRLVNIVISPTAVLQRVGGSEQMTLTIGPTDKGNSFVTTAGHPFRNPIQVGGTLNVGPLGINPPGQYSGIISITFIQE